MTANKTIIFLGSREFGQKNDTRELAYHIGGILGDAFLVRRYYFEDLLFHISNKQRSIIHSPDGYDLKLADLIVALNWYPSGKKTLHDVALTTALYLKENHVSFWNSEMLEQRSSTKLSTLWILASHDVAIPETYFSINHDVLKKMWLHDQAIVKDIAAGRGLRNYLAHSQQEFEKILAAEPAIRFMLQSFVPNNFDVRLVCFGGEVKVAIKRQRTQKETHLNNTSQGAKATLIPIEKLPRTLCEQAKTICRLMGRELAGIDYVVANDGTGRYICLEVNAVPQLTSGSYTDEKYQAFSKAIESVTGKEHI